MPISVGQLKANLRTIAVPYFSDVITITYRPSALTPENSSVINERIEKGEAKNVIIETLCGTLASWDIVDDKGEMYPINPDSLAKLDGPLLLAISEAIGEDARPKPKSAGKSFAR